MTSPTLSTRGLSFICLCLMVLGWIGAVLALAPRLRTEASTRAIDVAIDYNEMVALAGIEGMSLTDVFIRMKKEQATSVALQEETLATLELAGEVEMTPYRDADAPAGDLGRGNTYRLKPSPEAFLLIRDGLARIYPANHYAVRGEDILVSGDPDALREIGLGLAPWKVAPIKAAGLRIIPRLRGGAAVSARSLQLSLKAVADVINEGDGVARGVVVFDGLMLPGYRTLIPKLKDELLANKLAYGSVEFGKQSGDIELGKELKGHLVRVHSISQTELSELKPEEAVQRFGLAVKDRNIRVLYVHQPQLTNEQAGATKDAVHPKLESAATYLTMLREELTAQRFRPAVERPAQPFSDLTLPAPVLLLLFIGGGAGAMLWLLSILPVQMPAGQVRLYFWLMLAGLAVAAVTAFLAPDLGRIIFGLLTAGGFPMLALTFAYRKIERMPGAPGYPFLVAVKALLIAAVITLSGALLVNAMLSETRYLVKVGQFVGVKVSMAVPVFLLLWMIITDGVARPGEMLADYTARCRERIRGFLSQPIYVWGIAAAVVGMAALAVLIARSGNEGMDVSQFELQARRVLEQVFIARPRTKEFLFGVPMFICAMIAGSRRARVPALFFLFGAAIGLVDIFNTYCHSHTPLFLSLLRTANGLWLGILVTFILLSIFARNTLKRQSAPTEEGQAVSPRE